MHLWKVKKVIWESLPKTTNDTLTQLLVVNFNGWIKDLPLHSKFDMGSIWIKYIQYIYIYILYSWVLLGGSNIILNSFWIKFVGASLIMTMIRNCHLSFSRWLTAFITPSKWHTPHPQRLANDSSPCSLPLANHPTPQRMTFQERTCIMARIWCC